MSVDMVIVYAAAIAGITTVFVQLIKDGLVDPRMADTPARTALLRGINYLINFALLALALATQGAWAWGDLLFYIGLALGQSLGANMGYKIINKPSAPLPPPATPPDEVTP
jgi:hypothetical protein